MESETQEESSIMWFILLREKEVWLTDEYRKYKKGLWQVEESFIHDTSFLRLMTLLITASYSYIIFYVTCFRRISYINKCVTEPIYNADIQFHMRSMIVIM